MPRTFIVESESRAAVADLVNAAFEVDPLQRNTWTHRTGLSHTSRPQRHGPQRMLYVGHNELLVLLLVVQAEFDHGRSLIVRDFEIPQHCVVHARAVVMNFA